MFILLQDDQSDDSVLLTSSDDEIDVYDHPGPDNILEQDSILTSSSKVSKNQIVDASFISFKLHRF